MPELESPIGTQDFRDSLNGLPIGRATPGQEIRMLVWPANDETANLMDAVGALSHDGKSFSVVVTRKEAHGIPTAYRTS